MHILQTTWLATINYLEGDHWCGEVNRQTLLLLISITGYLKFIASLLYFLHKLTNTKLLAI